MSQPENCSVVLWKDPSNQGYYSRDGEFIAEFPISEVLIMEK